MYQENCQCPLELQLCGGEDCWISKLLKVCQQSEAGDAETAQRHEHMCEVEGSGGSREGKIRFNFTRSLRGEGCVLA